MSLQLNQQTRSFITHITATWTLSTTCALICLQTTHVGVCFIAQIKDMWTCSIKYNYVSEVCWCASIYNIWQNVSLHKSQPYGCKPLCISRCLLTSDFWLNVFLQTLQAYECWSLCISWWIFTSDFWLNVFFYKHYKRSRLCINWCLLMWDIRMNVFLQTLQA